MQGFAAEIKARGRDGSGLPVLPHFAGYLPGRQRAGARHYGGVGFLPRENLGPLHRRGIGADEVVPLGGGAQSDLWLPVKANICARAMVTPERDGSTAPGHIGGGDVPRFTRRGARFESEPAAVSRCDEKYAAHPANSERVIQAN